MLQKQAAVIRFVKNDSTIEILLGKKVHSMDKKDNPNNVAIEKSVVKTICV